MGSDLAVFITFSRSFFSLSGCYFLEFRDYAGSPAITVGEFGDFRI